MARKTLVIGLGSTGTAVCNTLIERLEWENGGLHRTPWIQFLAIETAGVANQPVDRTRNVAFLSIHQNPELISVAQHPEQWEAQFEPGRWLHPGITSLLRNLDGQGAGNIRQIGRLAVLFPPHLSQISSAVSERLQKLAGLDGAAAQRAFNGAPGSLQFPPRHVNPWDPEISLETGTDIYVVGTLCGGTSSGSFIDMPYILRSLPACPIDRRLVGIFSIYPPNGDRPEYARNTLVALREYHHWATEGITFTAKYNRLSVADEQRPYDDFFLVRPTQPTSGELDRLCSMVADYVYVRAFSPESPTIDARRADLAAAYDSPAPNLQQQNFATFGISGIEFPARRIVESCQLKLCANALNTWLDDPDGAGGRFNLAGADAQHTLADIQAVGSGLIAGLLKPEAGARSVLELLRALVTESAHASRGNQEVLATCKAQVEIAMGNQAPGETPAAANLPYRCVPTTVERNRQGRRDEVTTLLAEKLRERFLRPLQGIGYCRAWVTAARQLVENERRRYEPDPATHKTANQVRREQAEDRLKRIEWEITFAASDWFLGALLHRGWAVRALTDEWAAAMDEYVQARVAEQQDLAIREVLRAVDSHLQRHQKMLDPLAYPARYARKCRETVAARLQEVMAQPTLTNYQVLEAVDSATVERYYQAAFGAGSESDEAIARAQAEAEAMVLRAFEPLAEAVFPGPATTEEVLANLPEASVRIEDANLQMRAEDRLRLYSLARERFRNVEEKHVLRQLATQGANAPTTVGEMLAGSQLFLDVSLGDRTRFDDLPQKRAGFVFYNGQRLLGGQNTPQVVTQFSQWLQQAPAGTANLTEAHTFDPHRITAIREQHAFPLAIVSGFLAGGAYVQNAMRAQPRATWDSRSDLRGWYPIEPDLEAPESVRHFLILVATGRIDTSGQQPYLAVPHQEPVLFPRSLKELELQLTRDLTDPTAPREYEKERIRLLLDNEVHECRRRLGDDEFVIQLNLFAQGCQSYHLMMDARTPLNPTAAADWLVPYLRRDAMLWPLWCLIPGRQPQMISLGRLMRNPGDSVGLEGYARHTVLSAGFYCERCGFRIGTTEEEVRQKLQDTGRCLRCQRVYMV